MQAAGNDKRSEQAASACAFATQSAAEPGRALVTIETYGQAATASARPRPSAVFLAHLIAVAQQAPQTRQRRRAEPDEANAVYAEAGAPAARTGHAFCRSL
jgi:hypothetical protein